MKKLITCLFACLMAGNCSAKTFGCFMGVIADHSPRKFEIRYSNYLLFSEKRNSTEFLPFAGCGISFDF